MGRGGVGWGGAVRVPLFLLLMLSAGHADILYVAIFKDVFALFNCSES